MKRSLLTFMLLASLLLQLRAETPAGNYFSFSGIARNTAGQVLAKDTLRLQLSILNGSPTGPRVYREFHTIITDSLGVFSLTVGSGDAPLGVISTINWLNDTHFLNIAIDASGGNNFQSMSTTQILAIPVPVEPKKDTVAVVEEVFKHYLGEDFGGGLIFHIYKDSTGTEHGLIVSYTDVSKGTEWSNISSRFIGVNDKSKSGDVNTTAIMAQDGQVSSAAKVCRDYSNGGFADWYLPSSDELQMLWDARLKINKNREKDSNYPGAPLVFNPSLYWSSTEYNADEALGFDFNSGTTNINYKYNSNYVRAVRKF